MNHSRTFRRTHPYDPVKFLHKLTREVHYYDLNSLGSIVRRTGVDAATAKTIVDGIYALITDMPDTRQSLMEKGFYGEDSSLVFSIENKISGAGIHICNNITIWVIINDPTEEEVGSYKFSIKR